MNNARNMKINKKPKPNKIKPLDEKIKKELSILSCFRWEERFMKCEECKDEFRRRNNVLSLENFFLVDDMKQSENEMMTFTTHIKQQDEAKNLKISTLTDDLRSRAYAAAKEKELMLAESELKRCEFANIIAQKDECIEKLKDKLKKVHYFMDNQEAAEMEIEKLKNSLVEQKETHQAEFIKLDLKYFKRMMKLEKECEDNVSEVKQNSKADAERVILKEAIQSISETSGYRKETEILRTKVVTLISQITKLNRENLQVMTQLEVSEMNCDDQRKKLAKVRNENKMTEQQNIKLIEKMKTLELQVERLQRELTDLKQISQITPIWVTRLRSLEEALGLEKMRSAKVKALAQKIVNSRSEMEEFFLSALEQVKTEIRARRLKTNICPRARLDPAFSDECGRDVSDMDHLNTKQLRTNKPKMSHLSWEEKEKVISTLFVKLNARQKNNLRSTVLPNIEDYLTMKLFDNSHPSGDTIVRSTVTTCHRETDTPNTGFLNRSILPLAISSDSNLSKSNPKMPHHRPTMNTEWTQSAIQALPAVSGALKVFKSQSQQIISPVSEGKMVRSLSANQAQAINGSLVSKGKMFRSLSANQAQAINGSPVSEGEMVQSTSANHSIKIENVEKIEPSDAS